MSTFWTESKIASETPQCDIIANSTLQRTPAICKRMEKAFSPRFYHHNGSEFIYIQSGCGVVYTEKSVLPFQAPFLCYFTSKMAHGIVSQDVCDYWQLAFLPEAFYSVTGQAATLTGAVMENVLTGATEILPTAKQVTPIAPAGIAVTAVPETYILRIARMMTNIAVDLQQLEPESLQLTALHLHELGFLYRRLQKEMWYSGGITSINDTKTESMTSWEKTVEMLTYIETNLQCQLDALHLARVMHCSEANLYRLIREYTGQSLNHYVKSRRISQARMLLTITDLPIKIVANVVGIPDPAQFWRLFKEATGSTPHNYRQMGNA